MPNVHDEPILSVDALNVTLDGEHILQDLSFSVMPGDTLTILGPNGAGKTVLLKTLLGVLPSRGEIRWRKGIRIGYVPQRLPYIRDIPLSVADFFTLKQGKATPVTEMLGDVGLPASTADKRIGEISSGQFQRVLIAWALAGDPHVLLFDEPTTGVDAFGEETVYGLLQRVHDERHLTMLLITHDLAVVHKLSDEVLCLNKSLVCHGPPIDVLNADSLRQLYGTEVSFYHHEHSHE